MPQFAHWIRAWFVIAIVTAISACGDSSSDSFSTIPTTQTTPIVDNEDEETKLCSSSVTIQGRTLVTSKYDLDGDGCLSDSEVDKAIAEIKQEEALRSVDATIVEEEFSQVRIKKATLTGNANAIDGVAQLHTNLMDGKFQLEFDIFPGLEEGQTVQMAFSTGTAAQVLGGVESAKVSAGIIFSNLDIFGTSVECTYSDVFKFDCESSGVAVNTIDNSDIFTQLPAHAYLILLVCEEGKGCLRNHATIPVLLN
ncbi:MAG: hypothetical protein P8X74_08505 [Reinekea sp.]